MRQNIVLERFEWDAAKDRINQARHGVAFADAASAFFDRDRIIAHDAAHSASEPRWFCIGSVKGRIATVRFTWRGQRIRIIGAGFWRKGTALYEKQKKRS